MSLIVTLAKYCEGKSGDAFAAGGNICGSRGDCHRAAASAVPSFIYGWGAPCAGWVTFYVAPLQPPSAGRLKR